MIKYKIDIIEALRISGYSSTRMRREKLLGESYMTQLRRGQLVSWSAIDTICDLLNCQPGDLLEHIKEAAAPIVPPLSKPEATPIVCKEQPTAEAATAPGTEDIIRRVANGFRFDDVSEPSDDEKECTDEFNKKRYSFMEQLKNYSPEPPAAPQPEPPRVYPWEITKEE